VVLDNISGIPDWLSDALCRAVTGDGMVRRRLYENDDLTVLAFRRVVALTSIDPRRAPRRPRRPHRHVRPGTVRPAR
jgi:hypothetical protein